MTIVRSDHRLAHCCGRFVSAPEIDHGVCIYCIAEHDQAEADAYLDRLVETTVFVEPDPCSPSGVPRPLIVGEVGA